MQNSFSQRNERKSPWYEYESNIFVAQSFCWYVRGADGSVLLREAELQQLEECMRDTCHKDPAQRTNGAMLVTTVHFCTAPFVCFNTRAISAHKGTACGSPLLARCMGSVARLGSATKEAAPRADLRLPSWTRRVASLARYTLSRVRPKYARVSYRRHSVQPT